jgi:hypothetical protein
MYIAFFILRGAKDNQEAEQGFLSKFSLLVLFFQKKIFTFPLSPSPFKKKNKPKCVLEPKRFV